MGRVRRQGLLSQLGRCGHTRVYFGEVSGKDRGQIQNFPGQSEGTQRGATERGSGRPSRGRPGDGEGGRKLQVARTDNTGGVFILRQTSGTMGKRDMDQNHPQLSKERGAGVSNGRATADWGNKWRKGLFEERSKDTDGDQQMQDQNWRSDVSAKWDMIAIGKWMQKKTWKRWVTTLEWDQSHKTPITSTWTAAFLTREGEGHKVVGDWLRDKTISWKARRRLLQTNAGVFPCEARLKKWGKHPDGICELCKRCRETL
jgi:hypothetical protein